MLFPYKGIAFCPPQCQEKSLNTTIKHCCDHRHPIRYRELYAEAFRWFDPKRAVPPIHVSFYPYIGINHTIRVRDGEVFVRIGEICREMPLASHKGLAYILVGKLLRKKIPGRRDERFIDA